MALAVGAAGRDDGREATTPGCQPAMWARFHAAATDDLVGRGRPEPQHRLVSRVMAIPISWRAMYAGHLDLGHPLWWTVDDALPRVMQVHEGEKLVLRTDVLYRPG